uniref:Uncharacterized protein n=1 Tax=Myoviridae sp. ctagO6 TaxID=2826667 RepID=A0A8S5NQK3_9CAUD|nr:MAG TPA: hypothetical protein [Myoviridae sp. ctagO6]DAF15354.1 MAG TPA: hypothetical protein [Caudoviricetes sp.]DAG39417.1 MAG TPA: hypothetical protein [Caudoviricetes sp.]
MERLTFEGNFCDIAQCCHLLCPHGGSCTQKQVWERLKQYEDPGLAPEDCAEYRKFEDEIIASGKTFGWLVELLKADKDGRLLVLPCKVGDTVWAASGKIIKCEIDETYLCDSGGVEFLVSFNCDGTDCKRCPFNNWTQDCFGEHYCDCAYGNSSFKDSEIGKTIFLTREEAESALEAMKDD